MIHVDEEFKALIPPLSREEYKQLEENCVKEGIRDPLVVWKLPGNEILIDGHNRWEISARHAGIPFNIVYKEFENREAVKEWIIKNQLGRRNIPPYVRAELALKLKPEIEKKAKERMLNPMQNSSQGTTRDQVAKAAGVSHDTIHKVEKIQKEAPEETKEALRRGELSINSVYSGIIAAEHETKRQQEARELREAKHRAESYESGKVVAIGDARQNIEDNKLIFDEFKEKLYKARMAILQAAIALNNETIRKAVETADKRELIKENDELQECYRTIFKIQHTIQEVLDEK